MADVYFREEGALVPLSDAGWESEDELQALLAFHPELLTGEDEVDLRPRNLLLVGREVAIADEPDAGGRWSVDHLFLDQEGIPTIVETKRSTDTRLRREVVGQMLDYAANAGTYWTVAELRRRLEQRAVASNCGSSDLIAELVNAVEPVDEDAFWEKVGTNLATGRVRLVFVADRIPNELRRIVEFLGAQMSPCTVAAVEIRRYVGEGREMLVPRVIGAASLSPAPGRVPRRNWNLESFRQRFEDQCDPESGAVLDRVVGWTHDQGLRIAFGNGHSDTALFPTLDIADSSGTQWNVWLFNVATYGTVELAFQWLAKRPYFDQLANRRALRDRICDAVPGLVVPDDKLDKRPGFPLERLADERTRQAFLQVMSDALNDLRAHLAPDSGRP